MKWISYQVIRVFPYNPSCLSRGVATICYDLKNSEKLLTPTAFSSPKFYGTWNSTFSDFFLWAEGWSYFLFLFESTDISGRHNQSLMIRHKSVWSLSIIAGAFGHQRGLRTLKLYRNAPRQLYRPASFWPYTHWGFSLIWF